MIFMFILLAGSSTRMGSSTLKQFINISKKEIFEYSLETFDKIEKINKIFLVAQKDNFEHINQIILNKKYNHEIEIIEGGATRQESVFNSLNRIKNIASSSSIVIFHDACRPLITKETTLKIIDEAEKNDGATAYCPLFDSICEKNNENFINNSLNREKIVKLQTPQAFKFDIIYRKIIDIHEKDIRKFIIDNDEESFKIYTNKAIHSMYPQLRNKMLHIINK